MLYTSLKCFAATLPRLGLEVGAQGVLQGARLEGLVTVAEDTMAAERTDLILI